MSNSFTWVDWGDLMVVYSYSLKTDRFKVLGKNFQVGEFACHDGSDKVLIDSALIDILQKIRDKFGKPITVSSAYRTITYNRSIGSGDYSMHTKGQACDIYIEGVAPLEIAKFAEGIGVKGIGYYPPGDGSFVHVDTRTTKYFWIKKNGREIGVATHGYIKPEVKDEEEDEMIYNKVSEIPSWGTATVNKLIAKGALKGDGSGLNLNETMLRIFVILDRLGKL